MNSSFKWKSRWQNCNLRTQSFGSENNVLDILNYNSSLWKLSASQKRHLEALAEGPTKLQPSESVWSLGAPVDKAFLIVSGTVIHMRSDEMTKSCRRGSTGSMSTAMYHEV